MDVRYPPGTVLQEDSAREPLVTYDGKTMAERLLKPKPPGDAKDPRLEGRWRAA